MIHKQRQGSAIALPFLISLLFVFLLIGIFYVSTVGLAACDKAMAMKIPERQ